MFSYFLNFTALEKKSRISFEGKVYLYFQVYQVPIIRCWEFYFSRYFSRGIQR